MKKEGKRVLMAHIRFMVVNLIMPISAICYGSGWMQHSPTSNALYVLLLIAYICISIEFLMVRKHMKSYRPDKID